MDGRRCAERSARHRIRLTGGLERTPFGFFALMLMRQRICRIPATTQIQTDLLREEVHLQLGADFDGSVWVTISKMNLRACVGAS